MLKRLAVYVVYDKDGIVDDYIPYFLNELSFHIQHFIIVCNGMLSEAGKAKLLPFTNDIFVRPNIGFDVGAVQDVLLNLYGWEKIYQYDELLICNDTVFGPLRSLSEVFEKMDQRKVDYWGLIEESSLGLHSLDLECPKENSPHHIQTCFYNVKKTLLHSRVFRNFWEGMDTINSVEQVTDQYVFGMTKTFAEHGFTYNVYCDMSSLYSDFIENNYLYTYIESMEVIGTIKYPFINKRAFSIFLDDLLDLSDGYNLSRLMTYLDRETPYDTDLIWQHILRKYSLRSIYETLHLHHIFSTTTSVQKTMDPRINIAVICHLHYKDLIGECLHYIIELPRYIDIYITTGNAELKDLLISEFHRFPDRRIEVRLVENRGRDTAALLIDCRDIWEKYEYLCFVHDKKTAKGFGAPSVGKSFMRLLWENTLGSAHYINNILEHFEQNPRLGFMGVQVPYHNNYFNYMLNRWSNDFELTVSLSERLDLSVQLDRENQPISLGTAFWCRTASMRCLYQHQFERNDFPAEPAPIDGTIMHAIERIFPFVAQREGYFSATMATDRFSSARTVEMEYMLMGLVKAVSQYMPITNYSRAADLSGYENLLAYCNKYSTIYIYGAGDFAARVAKVLSGNGITYHGFIVSDDKVEKEKGKSDGAKPTSYMELPVYYLSEIASRKSDCGIILGLNRHNAAEVMPQLKDYGFDNVYKVF